MAGKTIKQLNGGVKTTSLLDSYLFEMQADDGLPRGGDPLFTDFNTIYDIIHDQTYDDVMADIVATSLLEVDNANYTVLDTDGYKTFVFKNLSADRYLYLPTLADNLKREILVINTSDTYQVIVTPEGTEKINDWNSPVNITEKYGWWRFIGIAGQWNGLTNGNSSIIKISSTSYDDLTTTNNTWDDVTGINLTLTPGDWELEFQCQQYYTYSSAANVTLLAGLGIVSGNNIPNILALAIYGYVPATGIFYHDVTIDKIPYSVSSNTTIYLKGYYSSSTSAVSSHRMDASSNHPTFIKARRIR